MRGNVIAGWLVLGSCASVLALACDIIVVNDFPGGKGFGQTTPVTGVGGSSDGGSGGSGGSTTTGTPTGTGTGFPAVCSGVCHGTTGQNPAPPMAIDESVDTSKPTVGAHQQHYGPSPWHYSVDCKECHVIPTALDCPSSLDPTHCNEQIDIVWGVLTRIGMVADPVYLKQPPYTCTNTYCHGSSLKEDIAGSPETVRTPSWVAVDGTQATCGLGCHSLPPGGEGVDAHPNDKECQKCHGLVIQTFNEGDPEASVWAHPEMHIDGILQEDFTTR
jgi:predicted CxxxxCH...CXXCH cytochrome family protein